MKMSPPELAIALVNGRKFRTTPVTGNILYMDKSITEGSPFICIDSSGGKKIMDLTWSDFDLTEIKEWHDNVSEDNPALCWVGDIDPLEKLTTRHITRYEPTWTYNFVASASRWKYAAPVKPEDLYKETT